MDRRHHVKLTNDELSLADGATIYGPGDEKIGTVSHLDGQLVVIDVGVFLGLETKSVAVDATEFEFMRDEDDDVYAVTDWTREHLEEMPEYAD